MFLLLIGALAHAMVSVVIVNNTRLEFDVGKEAKPYISNEVALNPHQLSYVLDKNKFRVGIRYKVNDRVKLDPHIFIQHQRKNDWILEYGPTLRLDVSF